jgi:hypothetical protein
VLGLRIRGPDVPAVMSWRNFRRTGGQLHYGQRLHNWVSVGVDLQRIPRDLHRGGGAAPGNLVGSIVRTMSGRRAWRWWIHSCGFYLGRGRGHAREAEVIFSGKSPQALAQFGWWLCGRAARQARCRAGTRSGGRPFARPVPAAAWNILANIEHIQVIMS